MNPAILKAFGLGEKSHINTLTSGLINSTWKVTDGEKQFVLQQVNTNVFKKPLDLAANIRMLNEYLKTHFPEYLFVAPLPTIHNEDLCQVDGYFRLFPFIAGSHTISVVSSADQAFEAAFQFGKFTQLLSGFDAGKLHKTIPNFHNLTLRYQQFEEAVVKGNPERIKQSKKLIDTIRGQHDIVTNFEKIQKSRNIRQRVIHHDTKISNVLFDERGKGMCVIDLDTIMSGYFISDVGDMLRTYLSPASEEVKEFDSIDVRVDIFQAIVQGYLGTMNTELSEEEHGLIIYAGLFLIYMQAIRFLADHLNNDVYYGARYEGHNFVRAGNQLELLKILRSKTPELEKIVAKESKKH